MACGDTNSGCGGGTTTFHLFSLDNLKYLLSKLSGKICLAVGSIKTKGEAPMHLDKTQDDEGIVITSTIDKCTTEQDGYMSKEDKVKLDSAVTGITAEGELPLHLDANTVDSAVNIIGSVDVATVLSSGVMTVEDKINLLYVAGLVMEFDYIQEEVDAASGRYRNSHISTPVYDIAWIKTGNIATYADLRQFTAVVPESGSDVFYSGWNAQDANPSSGLKAYYGSEEYMTSEGVAGAVRLDRIFHCAEDDNYYYFDGNDLAIIDENITKHFPKYAYKTDIEDVNSSISVIKEELKAIGSDEVDALRKAYPSATLVELASASNDYNMWFHIEGTGYGTFEGADVIDCNATTRSCMIRFLVKMNNTGEVNIWSNSDKIYLITSGLRFIVDDWSTGLLNHINYCSFELLIPFDPDTNALLDLSSKYYIDMPV